MERYLKPYSQDNYRAIYHGDSRDILPELLDNSVDLLATDPPYGISFMGKDWDTFNEVVPPQGAYQHKKGFKKLPRQNTASLTEFFVPIWRECLRVLKPGAFAFVMCSPRADVMSKQVSCLQEAGFAVGFTPIFWAYASGFPKAQNIGKVADKRLGVESKVVKEVKLGGTAATLKGKATRDNWYDQGAGGQYTPTYQLKKPTSEEGKRLDGSYGGFQPKPAVEVIIVAMKLLSEKTFVDQALKNQKGITWLDDGRIPYESEGDKDNAKPQGRPTSKIGALAGGMQNERERNEFVFKQLGRFPANLLVSDDVLGSFSRYFDLDKWWEERIMQLPQSVQRTFPFLIVPKASKSEKDKGLDMPEVIKSGLPLRDGSGDYVKNEYGDGSRSTRRTRTKNYHPTVKPLKLMSYLITLGSREGDIVLDPFIGSGTTALACKMMSRKCIGIEIEEKYCEIATNRCRQQVLL